MCVSRTTTVDDGILPLTRLVFSKDRAIQLHAFIRSYERHVTPIGLMHVLYKASTPRHAHAYEQLFRTTPLWVIPYEQTDFRQDVLGLLPSTGTGVFFVDDQVFIRPWKVEKIPGLSLRHGLHLTYCYSIGSCQPLPPHVEIEGLVRWIWSQGVLDWGYPFSLDGHLYDLVELKSLIECIDFDSPNSLESNLQQFTPLFGQRMGVCYRESRVVNVPWNSVQSSQYSNRHAHDVSAEQLLDAWEAKQQIRVDELYSVMNKSVHQEFPLILESRCA
jgi:hypothetical protein